MSDSIKVSEFHGGARLKQMYMTRGYKQKEFAALLGLTAQNFHYLEQSENPNLEVIRRSCALCQVSRAAVFSDTSVFMVDEIKTIFTRIQNLQPDDRAAVIRFLSQNIDTALDLIRTQKR